MNMKNLISVLVFSAAIAGTQAASAASAFSRFYISGGLGEKSVNVEQTVSGPGGAGAISLGDNSMFGQLAGGYNLAVGENGRLGFGAFVDVGQGKAGSASGTIGGVSATFNVKQKNHYGLSFEPGYAFTKDSVAYAKVTYNWIKIEQTLSGGTVASDTSTLHSVGYGMGLKHLINDKTYLYAEWQKVEYNARSFDDGAGDTINYKPSENFGLFGIGMTF